MKTRTSVFIRLLMAGVMLASMAGLSVAGAAWAQARPAQQSTSCHMKAVIKFRPGLTFNEQNQKIRTRRSFSKCVGGGVTGGTFTGRGGGSLSCTSGTGQATVNVLWNTNETSVVSLTIDVGNQMFSGTVTSGKFAGEDLTASNVNISRS